MARRYYNDAVSEAVTTYAGILTPLEIGALAGVSEQTIRNVARGMRVSLANKAKIEQRKKAMQFIRDNHKTMRCSEVAKKLKMDLQAVAGLARYHGLKFKGSLVVKQPSPVSMEIKGFFNEHARENWLI